MRTVVTGFGPFGEIRTNPAESLARESGVEFRILDVAYDAIDPAFDELGPVDRLLLLGVANRPKPKLERFARNRIGTTPDVRGVVRAGPIEAGGPPLLRSSWQGRAAWSLNAGTYLCNFTLWRALRRFPHAEVGFLHVVPFERMNREDQLAIVRGLIAPIQPVPLRG